MLVERGSKERRAPGAERKAKEIIKRAMCKGGRELSAEKEIRRCRGREQRAPSAERKPGARRSLPSALLEEPLPEPREHLGYLNSVVAGS